MATLVPCDGADQAQVATLLLGMAREKGVDTGLIRLVWDGFEVPDELLGDADRAVLEVPKPVVAAQEPPASGSLEASDVAPAPKPRRPRPAAASTVKKTEVQEA